MHNSELKKNNTDDGPQNITRLPTAPLNSQSNQNQLQIVPPTKYGTNFSLRSIFHQNNQTQPSSISYQAKKKLRK